MRRLLLTLGLLLIAILIHPQHAFAIPTHVQSCTNFSGSGSIATLTCTFGANITANDLVYACVAQFTAAVVTTLSGDGDTWVTDFAINAAGGSIIGNCFYVAHAAGGSTTLTFNFSPNAGFPAAVADEWSMTGASDQLDAGATGQFVATTTSGNITPLFSGELLVGFLAVENSPTITVGTNASWVAGAGVGAGGFIALEYFVQPSAALVNAQFGISNGNDRWQSHIHSFQAAAGVPPNGGFGGKGGIGGKAGVGD